ncbi:hypothetical protein ONE63_006235 [Megalurothrips usitatus]|uniref:C2H2-type domain-containing protein n=1 Tax=Megalurothrips usitatus TaxID=439358 RepID=A0AAV7XSS2_9NEOP|nr:hypothetical protein ONE63_006235 [Megalurothrips usitatus]
MCPGHLSVMELVKVSLKMALLFINSQFSNGMKISNPSFTLVLPMKLLVVDFLVRLVEKCTCATDPCGDIEIMNVAKSLSFTVLILDSRNCKKYLDLLGTEVLAGCPPDVVQVSGVVGGEDGLGPGLYQCSDCGKRYSYLSTLRRHVKLECGKSPQFHCVHCSYKTKHLALGLLPRWWLPNFQRSEITATRRSGIGDGSGEGHKCSGCGKTYLWRSTLTRHRQYECGGKEPMHQCPHCSYRARQREYADYSKKASDPLSPSFDCSNCGRSYRWRDNLRRHQRMECGKEASFWCSFCPFRSKHKHSLLRHLHNRHFINAAAAEAAADLAISSVDSPPEIVHDPAFLENAESDYVQ